MCGSTRWRRQPSGSKCSRALCVFFRRNSKQRLHSRNQAKCVNCSPGKDRTIAQWHSADGISWHERPGWQPKPGRLDNQEVIFWDEDAEFRGSRGAYVSSRGPRLPNLPTP